jgi:alpha-mannosidase
MRIAGVEPTDLFVGTPQRPLQVVRVTVVNENPPAAEATVHIHGPGANSHGSFRLTGLSPGEQRTAEVPVEIAAPFQPGSLRRATVAVESDAGRAELETDITVADTGWTMWMVSHFHYDPVWWNTQGQFTEARLVMPDEDGKLPDVRPALELVQIHLDKARDDADYKFVLAEIDYLKPFLDTYPERRAELRQLIRDGRVEIVGGNYNEPNTNLTGAESTIRNAVCGMGYQRDVAGGDPRTAWMLDVFGHDPGYPGLMAAAGLTSTAWARGPFHQWGPRGADGGGVNRMQFRSEFEWVSPDGKGLLTHYMAHHYGAGWRLHKLPDLETAEQAAYEEFRGMAQVAATRNVMLPVGNDHVIPANWVTEIHRSWNQKYVWPRFVMAVPSEFFAAVRADAGRTGTWFTPQTRDMNPIYTGKDVSCIDTKQAQRAIETAVIEAERIATVAALAGAPFPLASLDKTWRILAYCAHHDAVTGVEGDQVYLDLVSSWREAWERADAARLDAVDFLGGGDVTVFNGLARARSAMATVTLRVPVPGTGWLELRDEAGDAVPALAEGVLRHPDGSLAEVTLTFLARDVPALGARTFLAVPGEVAAASGWVPASGLVMENAAYRVAADPERGGTLTITDKRTGRDVLHGPGNELLLQDEYAKHPKHGEGPWHLSPKPGGIASSSAPAVVRVERCAVGSRLVATFMLDELQVRQETLLWDGAGRVEFRTHVDGSIGQDRLLRVRFPADVPGGLPLYQTATAVIGRPFGAADVDSADVWYTLDNPAYQWFGLGFSAAVRTVGGLHAFGVAEVIAPDDAGDLRELVRDLLVALVAAGVTATLSQPDGARYGGLDADSNVPDVRIALGGADLNAFNSAVLAASGPGYGKTVAAQLAADGTARVWVPATRTRADAFAPNADVRGTRDLPVLIVAGTGRDELAAAVRDLIADLSDAVIDVAPLAAADGDEGAVDPPLAERSVAVFNRGTPGAVVTPDGTLHMSLLRSCSAWPTGIWIDGERRGSADGSSFSLQHWTHTFEYALASGAGDWRAAGFNAAAEDYNHDLIAIHGGAGGQGRVAPAAGSVSVWPAGVTLSALKPRGNPLAAGRAADPEGDPVITVRLRETEGRAVTARVRVPGGASAAWLTDLLEETDGGMLAVSGGEVAVDMSPFSTVTLAVRTGAGAGAGAAKEPAEAVQPVHSRYWLHGKGPAPASNAPVSVHLSPTRVALPGEGDTAIVRLSVASGGSAVAGEAELIVPAGLELVAPPTFRYQLAPGGYRTQEIVVSATAGAAQGRYFLGARTTDASGQVFEDTAMVAVGEKPWPVRDLDEEEALERMLADYAAAGAEIELTVLTDGLRLAPGEDGELAVSVTSHLASDLRAESQLISPFGTWALTGAAGQAVTVAPGQTAVVRYPVRMPATARPGARWWALVKLMYFGRVWYTDSIPVTVAGGADDQ